MCNIVLPQERYIAALHRLRNLIKEGKELVAADSTTIGDKYTSCSWGLCSGEKEAWPDAKDHLWPDQFLERGWVAPLYRQKGQKCPFDSRKDDGDGTGCFFSCRVFQRKLKTPTREQALALYDEVIALSER